MCVVQKLKYINPAPCTMNFSNIHYLIGKIKLDEERQGIK